MCILCSVGVERGDRFRTAFASSRSAMRESAEALLACAAAADTVQAGEGYRAAAERMLAVMREWDAIELPAEPHRPLPPLTVFAAEPVPAPE